MRTYVIVSSSFHLQQSIVWTSGPPMRKVLFPTALALNENRHLGNVPTFDHSPAGLSRITSMFGLVGTLNCPPIFSVMKLWIKQGLTENKNIPIDVDRNKFGQPCYGFRCIEIAPARCFRRVHFRKSIIIWCKVATSNDYNSIAIYSHVTLIMRYSSITYLIIWLSIIFVAILIRFFLSRTRST